MQVLCGCGWGRLRCPRNEVPSECPLCGLPLDREIEVGEITSNPRLTDSRRVELPRRMRPRGACSLRRNAGIEDVELQRYSDYRPTGFDAPGLSRGVMGHGDDADRSEWLIVPVGRTRDSDAPEVSNFEVAEDWLVNVDPDGSDHERHRFGHWGPGWFEILIVRPGTAAHRKAQEIAVALENYPILEDLSMREADVEFNPKIEPWRPAAFVELIADRNRLRIRLVPEARNYVEALLEKPGDQAFAELVEYHLGNGWELLSPAEIGAITESPILSKEVERDEDGNLVSVGTVYWYPEYERKSEIEELLRRGEIVFTGHSARRQNGPLPRRHVCTPDGVNQRGRCVGNCECGEHLLLTGRYTPYCPSCQTCEACGCPGVDGFSHYEGCQLEPVVVESISVARNGRRGGRKSRHSVWVEGNPQGRRNEPRGIKSVHDNKFVVVEVDIGVDDSIDDLLADPNVTDEEIDAALAPFKPARTFDVRRDVEEILSRGGIVPRARSEEVGGAMRFAYVIPSTHNPALVANALRNYFKGQRDVKVSVQ